MKRENRTWTAVIDADEYIAFNYLDESSSEGIPSWCYKKHKPGEHLDTRRQCEKACSAVNCTCDELDIGFYCRIPECANRYLGESFRTQLDKSATAAEHIHKHVDPLFDMKIVLSLRDIYFRLKGVTKK